MSEARVFHNEPRALKAQGANSAYVLSLTFAPKIKPKSTAQSHDFHKNYSRRFRPWTKLTLKKTNFQS